MNRRDLILGAGCAAALAAAEALRPRTLVSLGGKIPLEEVIPQAFGDWAMEPGGSIVTPRTEGSLASTLYGETVGRAYRNAATGAAVMLLAAHGDTQSDLLQLHRPESCYRAVGFSVSAARSEPVALAPAAALPAVGLTATADQRIEDVLYWTRLGERFPRSAGEQRSDRLASAMRGIIADGILVRASWLRGPDTAPDFAGLGAFAAAMIRAVRPDARAVLIGSERAARLA